MSMYMSMYIHSLPLGKNNGIMQTIWSWSPFWATARQLNVRDVAALRLLSPLMSPQGSSQPSGRGGKPCPRLVNHFKKKCQSQWLRNPCLFCELSIWALAAIWLSWWLKRALYFLPSGKLTELWKITMFHGKTHYTWPFSIAFCMFTRPGTHKKFGMISSWIRTPQLQVEHHDTRKIRYIVYGWHNYG